MLKKVKFRRIESFGRTRRSHPRFPICLHIYDILPNTRAAENSTPVFGIQFTKFFDPISHRNIVIIYD